MFREIIGIGIILCTFLTHSQNLNSVDYISPFMDDMAAVKKNGQWGFIGKDGNIAINFRDDLVPEIHNGIEYPTINDGMGVIRENRDGIWYYGYIDEDGKTIIEPMYLNATNFKSAKAIAVLLEKEEIGKNNLLGKNVISYSYSEVIINKDGKVLAYLTDPTHITLDSKFLRTSPTIQSRILTENLVAVLTKDNKWNITKIEYNGVTK